MKGRVEQKNRSKPHALGDSVPVKLKRTVSEISEKWLFDYDMIASKKLSAQEVESSRRILNLDLGATLVDTRQVILDSIDKSRTTEHQLRQLKAIITDSLAAHEMGSASYLGHFSAYCHPRWAFSAYLLTQQEIYEDTYMLPALGPDTLACEISSVLMAYIQNLINSEWLAEMLSLISEKRRLHEHSLVKWQDPMITEFIASRMSQLDNVTQELSSYQIAKIALSRLREKLGNKLEKVLLELRENQLIETRLGPTQVATIHFPKTDGTEKTIMSYRDTSGILVVDPDDFIMGLIAGETRDGDHRKTISKSEVLSAGIRTIDHRNGIDEFPELRAMCIGDLWLALHSIIAVEWLSENTGMASVYLDKKAKLVCSSQAQKLALELLHFRNRVLGSCVPVSPGNQGAVLSAVLEFMLGRISLNELRDRQEVLPGPKYEIGMLEHRECFYEIQGRLSRYYKENKDKIDQQIKHPEAFFSRIL
jgi:hypothetical protein